MVRSMMNLITLPKFFWRYALKFAASILNMVPTKKVDMIPYEIWHRKAPKLSYLRVWGCEALVKQDTSDKLDSISIKYLRRIPKGNNGLLLLLSIREQDFERHDEVEPNEVEPYRVEVPIRRSERISQAPDICGFYIDAKEHELGDLNEPPNYKAALLNLESDKWLNVMNTEISKWLIALSQSAYFDKILKKVKMENSKRSSVPMQEKPDYRKSQGAKTPSEVKRMQRVSYASARGSIMYAIDKDDTKPQSGYVFVLNGGVMDWKSAKQSTIVMSSKKAKYIVVAKASMKAVWMSKFIDGLGDVVTSNKRSMKMLCDNTPAIAITNDPRIIRGA
ncbi:hypothetical protein Tco_0753363 [Tanacetum coccineum]